MLSALLITLAAPAAFSRASPASAQQTEVKQGAGGYYCIMDPDVKSKRPGKCSKCGMALRPIKEKVGSIPGEDSSTEPKTRATLDSSIKLQIPNTTVYDQDGKKLSFYADLVKGKTVAINFIFTTCTTICPPLAATFRKVQQELGERVGRDVQLISVSVDPTTDVPERLKGFLKKFNAGPGWTFITGSKPEVEQLLRALGAYVSDKNDHTPMILVGNDSTGYWTRSYGLAPASAIVRIINEVAHKGANP
jgi:cytochrome oxidase Cu insertion factor (SCO1/SenC/PrrC family)